MSEIVNVYKKWKLEKMGPKPHRSHATVEHTWILDELNNLQLSDMSARIAVAGEDDPGHMLIEKVTIEVTSTGGGPIAVLVDVKGDTEERDGKVFTDHDPKIGPGAISNEWTFVVHPNQYKVYNVYQASSIRKSYLRAARKGLGTNWADGVILLDSPDPSSSCILTVTLDFFVDA